MMRPRPIWTLIETEYTHIRYVNCANDTRIRYLGRFWNSEGRMNWRIRDETMRYGRHIRPPWELSHMSLNWFPFSIRDTWNFFVFFLDYWQGSLSRITLILFADFYLSSESAFTPHRPSKEIPIIYYFQPKHFIKILRFAYTEWLESKSLPGISYALNQQLPPLESCTPARAQWLIKASISQLRLARFLSLSHGSMYI